MPSAGLAWEASANQVAERSSSLSGLETRVVILGHLQRGGTPTPFDRWLATRFGVTRRELAVKGLWGQMVALRGTEITHVPIFEAVQTLRRRRPGRSRYPGGPGRRQFLGQ